MSEFDYEEYKREREFHQKHYDYDKEIEATKVWIDYLKHIATLSTGSIVLLSTFLEKVFAKPAWKAAVVLSLLGFLVAIIASLVSMSALTVRSENWTFKTKEEKWIEPVQYVGMLVCWCGFATGMVSLTIFTIRNLF